MRADHAFRPAVFGATHYHAAGRYPFPTAVLAQHAVVHGIKRRIAVQIPFQIHHRVPQVIRVDAVGPFAEAAPVCLRREAQHFLVTPGIHYLAGLHVPIPYAFAGAFQRKAPAFLAFAQGLLCLLALNLRSRPGSDDFQHLFPHRLRREFVPENGAEYAIDLAVIVPRRYSDIGFRPQIYQIPVRWEQLADVPWILAVALQGDVIARGTGQRIFIALHRLAIQLHAQGLHPAFARQLADNDTIRLKQFA